jgi:nucleosome assembly protein 1-like 1
MDVIAKIVKGVNMPTLSDEEKKKYNIKEEAANGKAIPDYWANVLDNSQFFPINERDKEILKHLVDIRVIEHEDKVSFTIEFEFTANEYFTNNILSKTFQYEVKDQELHKIDSPGVNWTSPDKIPNKIVKTKTVKSNI